MITKICVGCNIKFETKDKRSKYCNRQCYNINVDSVKRIKNRRSYKGINNPFYGKKHSQKVLKKITKDITGQKFGKLTAIRFDHDNYIIGKIKYHYNYWLFKCDCGKEKVIEKTRVMRGNTTSCGCVREEMYSIVGKMSVKHGMSKTKFYKAWSSMRERCLNKSHFVYNRYGGRGIKICKRWEKFENFKEDMYKNYLEHNKKYGNRNTSLDRFPNNNGNYCQKNCRWATQKEQNNNRRIRNK